MPLGRGGRPRALRLGLRQVGGLRREDAARIVEARDPACADLGTLRRRARVSMAAIETRAAADAFRSMGLDRRQALWQARALDGAPALPLFEAVGDSGEEPEPPVALPGMTQAEQTVEDWRALRLSLRAHSIVFPRKRLAGRDVLPAEAFRRARDGARAAAAGLVLVRQQPGRAGGVVFLTLEDETGTVNIVIQPAVLETCRPAVRSACLALVRGRVQRVGPIVHLVAVRLEDRTHWLDLLTPDEGVVALSPEGAAPHGSGAGRRLAVDPSGPPRNRSSIPNSRDFR